MGFLVFCDTDENGTITTYLAGYNVIPSKQYDYFFYLSNEIDASEYKVVNGQLVRK
jgi:hypothetical protein